MPVPVAISRGQGCELRHPRGALARRFPGRWMIPDCLWEAVEEGRPLERLASVLTRIITREAREHATSEASDTSAPRTLRTPP